MMVEYFKREWLFNVAADLNLEPSTILVFARRLCDMHPDVVGIHHTSEGMEDVAAALGISTYSVNRYTIKLVQNRHLTEPDSYGWCKAVITPLLKWQRQRPQRSPLIEERRIDH